MQVLFKNKYQYMQKLTCNNIGFYEFIAKIAIKSRQTKNNANLSSNQLNSYLYT